MRIGLFGIGTDSYSKAITAQRRINCYVRVRQNSQKAAFSLIGRLGLQGAGSTGSAGMRGAWAVNSLSTPVIFIVNGNVLSSLNNAGGITVIGTIGTSEGQVSMADDGTYLVLVDGTAGYYYNMVTPGALTQITDGNFTSTPTTVTWQDTYFIVTSSAVTKQFQLSDNNDPSTWPAVNINFAGSGGGMLQAGIADHNLLNIFGDIYTEFWQNTGSPDFPYAKIPSASAQYGLAAPFSLVQFDNSLVGLFTDKNGNRNISRLQGFALQRISDDDIDYILSTYDIVDNCSAFVMMIDGHPCYVINFPNAARTFMYDAATQIWSELEGSTGNFQGWKSAFLLGQTFLGNRTDGSLYRFGGAEVYEEAGSTLPMEVISDHLFEDDKYIGISQVQIDVQSGVGTATGQGSNPMMDLRVSKDGGNSFYSVGFSSMGPIGEYTQRVIWNSLGAARDWVLKLRITDPVKRVITGASAEINIARF
jgi:hypothetical protein